MPTISFNAAATPSDALEERPLAPPSAEPLSGTITTRAKAMYLDDEQRIVSGIWECEPGVSRWTFDDRGEFITVVSGRMTVTEDGGQPLELVAGSSAVFPLGWNGIWDVQETLRKAFVVFRL
jgi:uncharacterized cupin superfamily protein